MAVALTRFRRGRPAGCSFPSSPRRSVPPRLGLALRALLGAPIPGPGPTRPLSTRPPAPQPGARGPGLRVGAGRGSLCPPHTRPLSPSPAVSRALGGARSPGPSAPRLPAGAPPRPPAVEAASSSPPSPLPTCAPTPPGTSANGGYPGPRTYLHGSTKPRSGGGEIFRPPLSLIGLSGGHRGLHWLMVDVRQSGGAGQRGRGMLVPWRLCLSISLSLSRLLETRDIWIGGLEGGLRWKEKK